MKFIQYDHLTLHYTAPRTMNWDKLFPFIRNLSFLKYMHSVWATENGSRQLFLWDILLRTTKQTISPVEVHKRDYIQGYTKHKPSTNSDTQSPPQPIWSSLGVQKYFHNKAKLTQLETEDFQSPKTTWASQLVSPVKTDVDVYTSHSVLIFIIYIQHRFKN